MVRSYHKTWKMNSSYCWTCNRIKHIFFLFSRVFFMIAIITFFANERFWFWFWLHKETEPQDCAFKSAFRSLSVIGRSLPLAMITVLVRLITYICFLSFGSHQILQKRDNSAKSTCRPTTMCSGDGSQPWRLDTSMMERFIVPYIAPKLTRFRLLKRDDKLVDLENDFMRKHFYCWRWRTGRYIYLLFDRQTKHMFKSETENC